MPVTINTPGPVGDLSAYTFTLGSTTVQDQAGNSAGPAGQPLLLASGADPSKGQVATLPAYTGDFFETGLATELGDLAGKSFKLTDYVPLSNGPFPANFYRFEVSSNVTMVPKLNGSFSPLIFTEPSVTGSNPSGFPVQAQKDGSYQLSKGVYYLSVTNQKTGTPGVFTLTLTTSGTGATAPAPVPGFSSSAPRPIPPSRRMAPPPSPSPAPAAPVDRSPFVTPPAPAPR